ncbi:hypothetical protein N0V82_004103 [Gnomoniopsis sp. IMI 355080]|nr:hypothetical protein N0V82_004103 [Gnomoniopsis sp. IMI 355080]
MELDRSNISNALSDSLTEDLGITSYQVSNGNQLMLAGIIISEIPANLVLQRLGAPIWLTVQLLIWGTIALTQAWCTGLSSFYATRFLLGIFEGGYIPGAQYMLALFYTEGELARRTAIFYFGNYLATAVGSLIAAAVLRLGGVRGLSGWQWLFIMPFAFIALLPRSTSQTKPLVNAFDLFSDDERSIMKARISRSDASRSEAKAAITWASVLASLTDPLIWMHCALNVLGLAPKGGLQLYGPTIIKGLGFSTTKANLLNSRSQREMLSLKG